MLSYLVQMFVLEAEFHAGSGYTHGEMKNLVLKALLLQGAHAAVTTIVVAECDDAGQVMPLVWLTKDDDRWTGFRGDSKKLGVSPGLIAELEPPRIITVGPREMMLFEPADGGVTEVETKSLNQMSEARLIALKILDDARKP